MPGAGGRPQRHGGGSDRDAGGAVPPSGGGAPNHLRSDNGPEFAAKAIRHWTERLQIGTLYVAPASPWENGDAESFHSKLRDEFLAAEEFGSLREARALTSAWKREYNEVRPHSSLGLAAPAAFARTCGASVRPPASFPPRTSCPPVPALIATGPVSGGRPIASPTYEICSVDRGNIASSDRVFQQPARGKTQTWIY
ncbi:integrase core domain-containing protein [Alienimonas californiensis]